LELMLGLLYCGEHADSWRMTAASRTALGANVAWQLQRSFPMLVREAIQSRATAQLRTGPGAIHFV